MLRAHNDSKRSCVSRSKVLISADDLSKSRRVKECQKVCHATGKGAKETAVTSATLCSFIGIRSARIKCFDDLYRRIFSIHMQLDAYKKKKTRFLIKS